jgi:hypothetical protein
MKNPSGKQNERKGFWSFFKKAWQGIWNSGGSIHDCPNKARSAQEIRDEYAEKCPWKGDLF